MAATRQKALTNTYTELYRYEKIADYERALKLCDKILLNYPDEKNAYHCKIVSLMQLSQFEEAFELMKNNAYAKNLDFEKAYCLYRCNKTNEAMTIVEGVAKLTLRLEELRAQILYRNDRFKESFEIYKRISKSITDDYKDERETNLAAALTYSGDRMINNYKDQISENTYELCFNKACILIQLKQYTRAEKKLLHCEKLCRDTLENDGMPEEEILRELAHIKIQLGYIYHVQGRIREAHQLYTSSLKLKLEDIALAAVACNNVIIINKDQNIFDSKKKLKIITNEMLNFKLNVNQQKHIYLNRAMLHYYTNQYAACNKICAIIENLWPDTNLITSVLRSFVLVKEGRSQDAIDLITEYPTDDDGETLQLRLCHAQIWLMQGDRLSACEVLEDAGVARYRPGIVGALITLYLAEGKEAIAQKIYKQTVDWYKRTKKSKGDLTNLWRQAAEFHLRNGQPQVAASSLEELLREHPNDKKALGQLIIAYSEFNKTKAISLAKDLFVDEDFYAGIDIDNVDSSAWLSTKKVPANNSPAVSATPSSESLDIVKKKKHRKRKCKMPKNYDPKVPPDPERWLPKYERTGYRKKRDRRVKEVIKGSQGTASGQAEQFDFSSKMVADSEQQDSPRVEPSPSGKQHHPPQQQQKNKGQKKKNKRR